ncbi:c-type heme family protein [Pseudodesulfovibrio portus]|uniref:histidine kinase n=1 Tax=Pseudodesulfovibrio portus TaxID=231439 RepID=A0ABM8AVC9_9BACT|nr:DUF3365 domain-containing protein [Pseudodesulfovibrio portus]BDQ35490.1 sensor histidine kinase [Pseudodesulfovibrio portus]
MANLGPKKLQAKFLVGLGTIVLLLGVFFASSLYFHLSSLLDTQVREKADLMFAQVSSVQSYVREVLRPKMFASLPDDEFIIEAMSSSYMSRAIMDRLDLPQSEYHYRRVAENARNPLYEINPEEKDLLALFRANPGMMYWEGYRQVKGSDYFVKARPVIFKQSCLTCHGDPVDSPPVLIERYGVDHGFGHERDALDGLVVVGIPVEQAVARIREATMGYAALYGAGMLIFFALVQAFFNRLIMTNLRRLTAKFRNLFDEEPELRVLEKLNQEDEIEEVVQGLEELGDHLHSVHSQLRQHSENLEEMVVVRTSELQQEADERRSDVSLFVQLLDGLNRSHNRREMWKYSLPLLVKRFNARSAGFICMFASRGYYTYPEGLPRPELPENWKEILVDSRSFYEDNRAFIPVGASDEFTEGILYLEWEPETRIKVKDQDILRALGQQLGIAMENLSALNNLLRQKDMLQGIVEGIGDPLLLMDAGGNVVLANEAARRLAKSLDGSMTDEGCAALFKSGGSFEEFPVRAAQKSGMLMSHTVDVGDRHFVISIFPIAGGESGEGQGVVYVRDVTQERHMLETMQQSEKLATVGQLAAGLAHEMNNPLGVIKCYAELLKTSVPGQEIRPDAEIILKHATQAQNVLQDLLNFARPKRAVQARLDVGGVVADAMSVFRVQADKKGVTLLLTVGDGLPDVMANEQYVEQIIANLLKNALDAVVSETGRIEVGAELDAKAGMVVLRVADNGPGVPEEHLKSLFDPFFSTKEVGEGTGLGLAVVYGLVQEMGGAIRVGNHGGAVFEIRLPVDETQSGGGEE